MGFFSFVGDILGIGGGSQSQSVSTAASSTTEVNVDVTPQIAIDFDLIPVADAITGLSIPMGEYNQIIQSYYGDTLDVQREKNLIAAATLSFEIQKDAVEQIEADAAEIEEGEQLDKTEMIIAVAALAVSAYYIFRRKQ